MKKDILNRQDYIIQLKEVIKFAAQKKEGCCFAIEGEWGVGKTFILDIFEKQMELIQSEKTNNDKYYIFDYNCWKYDYYEEPLVAIVASMLDSIKKQISLLGNDANKDIKASLKIAFEIVEDIADDFISSKIGIKPISTIKEVNNERKNNEKKENNFDKMFHFKNSLDLARKK